jgi:cysteine synthase B
MTGREIAADLDVVDYFVGGLGTTGSTRGAGEYLKSAGSPQLKSIGIVCTKGGLIPGIRNSDEMHEVGLFERDFYDEIIEVSIDEAIDSMLTLVKSCGVLSGPTGGSSLAGALKFLRTIDDTLTEKKNAVFLVCDRAEWYLSYMQKYRPELFGMKKKDSALAAIDEAQCQSAPSFEPDEAEKWLKEENVLLERNPGGGRKKGPLRLSGWRPIEKVRRLLQPARLRLRQFTRRLRSLARPGQTHYKRPAQQPQQAQRVPGDFDSQLIFRRTRECRPAY